MYKLLVRKDSVYTDSICIEIYKYSFLLQSKISHGNLTYKNASVTTYAFLPSVVQSLFRGERAPAAAAAAVMPLIRFSEWMVLFYAYQGLVISFKV